MIWRGVIILMGVDPTAPPGAIFYFLLLTH
jgi:hypothetical protein